jgi:tyrosine-protein kinase Etk/Wzc
VTDAAVLTTRADLVLLVLQVGRVPVKLAGRTRDVLGSVQAPVAGVILNDKSGKGVQYYGYYSRGGYTAYGYGYEEKAQRRKPFWRRK